MQKALDQLGFGKCYHMRTAMNEYPRDCAMWLEAFEAKYDGKGSFGKRQWDQLLGHYSSVCDLPAIAFGRELMATYPDAKIILTNRDAGDWHRSCGNTLLQARNYWLHAVLQRFDWVTGLVHPLRCKYWQCLFADNFEANRKAAMLAHYEEIRAMANQSGRKVLEFGFADGWGPLCTFLDVDVPSNPYPRENEGGDWIVKMRERARLRGRAAAGRLLRAASMGMAVGLGIWWVQVMIRRVFWA
ncbi:hypothetical protein MMC12_007136 [Toensbergia leucococca]|nr:hypothetical protein [Toensbergia leucococca]